jgi:hypothetical protein
VRCSPPRSPSNPNCRRRLFSIKPVQPVQPVQPDPIPFQSVPGKSFNVNIKISEPGYAFCWVNGIDAEGKRVADIIKGGYLWSGENSRYLSIDPKVKKMQLWVTAWPKSGGDLLHTSLPLDWTCGSSFLCQVYLRT